MPPPVNCRASSHVTAAESTSPNAAIAQSTSDLTEASSIAFPDIDWDKFNTLPNPIAAFEISHEGKTFFTAVARLTQEAESVTSKHGLLTIPRSILQRTGVSVNSLPPADGETGHQIPINNPEQEFEILKLTTAAFKEIGAKLHELKHETNPARKKFNLDRLTHLIAEMTEEWSACAEGIKGRLSDFLVAIRAESSIQNSVQSAKQQLVNATATQFWNSRWDSRDPRQREWMLGNQQHFINGVYKELGHFYGLDKEVIDNYALSNFVQEHVNELIALLDKALTESAIARVLATDYLDRLVGCLGDEQWTQPVNIEQSWGLFNQKLKDAQNAELTPAFGEVLQSQIIALDGENFHLRRDLSALSEQLVRNARQAACLSGVATATGYIRLEYNNGYLFKDPDGRLWQEGRAPGSPPEPVDPNELGNYLLSQTDSSLRNLLRVLGENAENKAIVLDALIKDIQNADAANRLQKINRTMKCDALTAKDRGRILSVVMDRKEMGIELLSVLDDPSKVQRDEDQSLSILDPDGLTVTIELDVLIEALVRGILACTDPAKSLVQLMKCEKLYPEEFDVILCILEQIAREYQAPVLNWKSVGDHLLNLDDTEIQRSLRTPMDSETRALIINALAHGIRSKTQPECELLRLMKLSCLDPQDLTTLASRVTDPTALGNYIINELDTQKRRNLLRVPDMARDIILDAVAMSVSACDNPAQALWKFLTATIVDPLDFDNLLSRLSDKADIKRIREDLTIRVRDELSRLPTAYADLTSERFAPLTFAFYSGLLPLGLDPEHIESNVQWLQDFFSSHDRGVCNHVLYRSRECVRNKLGKLAQSNPGDSRPQPTIEQSRIVTAWNATLRALADNWDALPAQHTPTLLKRTVIYASGLCPVTFENMWFQKALNSGFLREKTALAGAGDQQGLKDQANPSGSQGRMRSPESLGSVPSPADNPSINQTRKFFMDLVKDENIEHLIHLVNSLSIDPLSAGEEIGAYGNQTLLEFAQTHGGLKACAFLQQIVQRSTSLNH